MSTYSGSAQSSSPSNGAGAVTPGMAGMLVGAIALVAGAFLNRCALGGLVFEQSVSALLS
ncbi:hypothetical protein BZA77DRAFT_357587 [Pyronema omphalodes]|nr:hypothetical protein BZA77DRAFT_357587 [Pyronema omphalodes]